MTVVVRADAPDCQSASNWTQAFEGVLWPIRPGLMPEIACYRPAIRDYDRRKRGNFGSRPRSPKALQNPLTFEASTSTINFVI
jgi:hypothetical protein